MEIKNNCFYKGSKPVFYLADTCWSAFTNIKEADWIYYLDYRKKQGFNVIQVNMLWQWDASTTDLDILPYELAEDGSFDFERRNEHYFSRVYKMIQQAHERDMTIALVLLWANYLPDTWATKLRETSIFPKEKIEEYVDFIMQQYNEFHPIYIISGDTDFPNNSVIEYYQRAIHRVKKNDPQAITSLHIRGRESQIPDKLQNDKALDFYMYQSGHNKDFQETAYTLAEEFSHKIPKKPVINSEPCYEMMGYSRKKYGRFSREDVRKAAWQSVFSGASAGITYGAHGIWSWHSADFAFDSSIGEAFETPYDWRQALHFEGAWDYAYLKEFTEKNNLLSGKSKQNLLLNQTEEIRIMENEQAIYIYIPSNIQIKLKGQYPILGAEYIDLESKKREEALGKYDEEEGITIYSMHTFLKDTVLFIPKEPQ